MTHLLADFGVSFLVASSEDMGEGAEETVSIALNVADFTRLTVAGDVVGLERGIHRLVDRKQRFHNAEDRASFEAPVVVDGNNVNIRLITAVHLHLE